MTKSRKHIRILTVASSLAALLALLPATRLPAQSSAASSLYADAAEKLRRLGLQDERAYDLLRDLTALGPRLTGSPQAAAAVTLTAQMMQDLELDDVHYETVTVSRWVRGEAESASIVGSSLVGDRPMSVCALGGSVPTSEVGVTAPVVEVKSLQDLAKIGAQVKGKIVFFNRAMDRSQGDVFAAYGVAAEQRVRGAADAAKLGAVAVLIRSLTLRIDDHPHTGAVEYESQAPKIPAAAISTRDAEFLSALVRRDQNVRVRLQLNSRTLAPVTSVNVVGQITGTAIPNEVVLVGGHLDSWDLSPGAHDDGAGCVIALEALRLIKDAGLKPRRTIRAVMFMDEENGGTGGAFYVKDPRRKTERHIFAMESDRGGFLPILVAAGQNGQPRVFEKIRGWESLFLPLGIREFIRGGGAVDIGPLSTQGTVFASVVPDSQRYFDVHHSALDVLAAVHPRELELNAVATALLAYLVSQEGL